MTQPSPSLSQDRPSADAKGAGRLSRFRKDYVPELDGLRGLAVLLVLWVHLPPFAFGTSMFHLRAVLTPGNAGVDLFFVLSGFLITRILLVDSEAGIPLRQFLIRRFLRIFPIYYLTIALVHQRLSSTELLACQTYTGNFVFLFTSGHSSMDHSWSLAVEEHFYIFWPPIVAFLSPKASFRVLVLGVLPFAVLCVVATALLGDWAQHGETLKEFLLRASPVRFFSLGLGSIVAYREMWLRRHRALTLGLAAVCLFAFWALKAEGVRTLGLDRYLAQIPSTLGVPQWYLAPLLVIAVPLGSVALVMSALVWTGTKAPHCVFLRWGLLRWVGRISYGLYLYHFPIFTTGGVYGSNPETPSVTRVLVLLGLCFLVATVSFYAIERPLLRYGARFRGRGPGGKPDAQAAPKAPEAGAVTT